jgi:peroxiredoxin family protein
MEVMEIEKEHFIDEVSDVAGAALMIEKAQQSEMSLFI